MAIDKKKKEAVKTVVKITDAEEKKKALDTAIAYIEKQFGKGAPRAGYGGNTDSGGNLRIRPYRKRS